MMIAILSVMVLYIAISIVVFGDLSLDAIVQAKDYVLAEAAKPLFGVWGFKIIAVTLCGNRDQLYDGKTRRTSRPVRISCDTLL